MVLFCKSIGFKLGFLLNEINNCLHKIFFRYLCLMNWYEKLPPNCPPLEAFATEETYFRLGSIPPSDSDFWSHRQRFPNKAFNVSECVARSLSVFDNFEAAERLKKLLPMMRTKPVFQVDLTNIMNAHIPFEFFSFESMCKTTWNVMFLKNQYFFTCFSQKYRSC